MPAQTKMISNLKNHFESYNMNHRQSLNLERPKSLSSRLHLPRRSLNIDQHNSSPLSKGPNGSPKSVSPQRSPTFFHHRKLHLSRSMPSFKMASLHYGNNSSGNHGNISHHLSIPHVDQSIMNRNMLSLLTLGQLPEEEEECNIKVREKSIKYSFLTINLHFFIVLTVLRRTHKPFEYA